jgi:hypothetical protein
VVAFAFVAAFDGAIAAAFDTAIAACKRHITSACNLPKKSANAILVSFVAWATR